MSFRDWISQEIIRQLAGLAGDSITSFFVPSPIGGPKSTAAPFTFFRGTFPSVFFMTNRAFKKITGNIFACFFKMMSFSETVITRDTEQCIGFFINIKTVVPVWRVSLIFKQFLIFFFKIKIFLKQCGNLYIGFRNLFCYFRNNRLKTILIDSFILVFQRGNYLYDSV